MRRVHYAALKLTLAVNDCLQNPTTMWKTLLVLWSVNLCLSDSRIKTSAENALRQQEGSEISYESECRQICRESLSTKNPYCGKSLIINKWCAIMLCNKLCHTTEGQMITDPLLGINYLKKRRKRNTGEKPRNKKRVKKNTSTPTVTSVPTKETTKITIIPTAKTVPAGTEKPEKLSTKSTEKPVIISLATSRTAGISSITTTAKSTTSTEAVNGKINNSMTLNPIDKESPGVYTTVPTSTESAIKTTPTLRPSTRNIETNDTKKQNYTIVTLKEINPEEKTTPGKIAGTVLTAKTSTEPTVLSTIVSSVPKDPSTNPKEPLPANPTEAYITKSSPSNMTLTSTKEPVQLKITSISTTTTVAVTTVQVTTPGPPTPEPTTPEPTTPEPTTPEPTTQLPQDQTTTRPITTTASKTTLPVLLTTKRLETTSSPDKTTSTSKTGTSLSTSSNTTTSQTSKPDFHALTSPKIATVDGNQKKDDNSIVIIAGEVTKRVENTSFLLAVLLLGNLFFIAVIVLFLLQAYESYKKKDYTQVDYLINGMYADSEM